MQTPEVRVHTADNQQETKQPECSMSRRYCRRIVVVVIIGFVSIFAFVMFSVVRAPGNQGWKEVVQNMHVPGQHLHNDYLDGVNLEGAEGKDNGDEDEESHEEDLLNPLGDSRKIIDSDNKEQDELAANVDDENGNNGLDDEPNKATPKVLDKNDERLQLPEVFLIRNEKGEVIGVKDVPKGLLDLLKMTNESRDRQVDDEYNADVNENGFPREAANPFLRNDVQAGGNPWQGGNRQDGGFVGFGGQQRGFGAEQGDPDAQQRGFGAQQGDPDAQQRGFGAQQGDPDAQQRGFGADQRGPDAQQRGFGAQQGDLDAQQRGFAAQQRFLEAQQGRFGANQGGLDAQQGGFGAQQDGLGAQPAEINPGRYGNEKNIGQKSLDELKKPRMKTFGEYLQNKNLQNDFPFNKLDAFQPAAGQQAGYKKYQDNVGANNGGGNQNEGFGWKNAFPGNANGDNINNNKGNGLDLMKDINQFLKNKNNALQNNPIVPGGNNNLQDRTQNNLPQDLNPFNRANNNLLNNINPFLRGNNVLQNPNLINQDGNIHEQNGARKINDDFKNEPVKQRQDEKIKSIKDKRLTLLKQNIFMEDLTARVTVLGNCVTFRFPTGSGPLCIHSADLDPNVSGKIDAKEDYERDIMDQMLFILSNDSSLGFIDLGAGFGIYSMAAALLNREVLAVEPLKINCQLFHRNARENNVIHKIILLRQAIDNESYLGLVETSNSTGGYSEAHISKLPPNIDKDQLTDMDKIVRVTTLNKIAPAAPFKRALLKIDVSTEMGPRILNLKASLEFFKTIDVPYILIHWPFSSHAQVLAKTVSQLIPLGYRPRLTFDGPDANAESLHSDQPLMVWKKQ